MSEHWCVEKTKRTDGTERLEIHLGDTIYIISLEKGEELARNILGLLGIDVAELKADTDVIGEDQVAKVGKQAYIMWALKEEQFDLIVDLLRNIDGRLEKMSALKALEKIGKIPGVQEAYGEVNDG